jgi:hypothetical protein
MTENVNSGTEIWYSALSLPRCTRLYHWYHCNPNNCVLVPLWTKLCLDRLRVPARQRRVDAHLGNLSDIWGRKAILLLAILIFAAGSIICAAATMMGMMLTGRSIQGAAASGIVILVNICISDLFTERFVSACHKIHDPCEISWG